MQPIPETSGIESSHSRHICFPNQANLLHVPNYIALATPSLRNLNSVFPGFKSGQQVKEGWRKKNSQLARYRMAPTTGSGRTWGNCLTHKLTNASTGMLIDRIIKGIQAAWQIRPGTSRWHALIRIIPNVGNFSIRSNLIKCFEHPPCNQGQSENARIKKESNEEDWKIQRVNNNVRPPVITAVIELPV